MYIVVCRMSKYLYIVTRKEKGSVLHKIIYPGSSIITKGVIKVDCSEF